MSKKQRKHIHQNGSAPHAEIANAQEEVQTRDQRIDNAVEVEELKDRICEEAILMARRVKGSWVDLFDLALQLDKKQK